MKLLIIYIFLSLPIIFSGQDSLEIKKHFISTSNLFLYPINEIGINYENKISNNVVFGSSFSVVYNNKKIEWFPIGMLGIPTLFYKGVSSTLTLKRYTKSYFKGILVKFNYKEFYNRKVYKGGWGGSDDSYSIRQSNFKTTLLIQYIRGKTLSNNIFRMETYSGIGLRLGYITSVIYAKEYNRYGNASSFSPKTTRFFYPMLTISIGASFGKQFN